MSTHKHLYTAKAEHHRIFTSRTEKFCRWLIVSGFYQGQVDEYVCQYRVMVQQWRALFAAPALPFVHVQLAPWVGMFGSFCVLFSLLFFRLNFADALRK
jgi:hypothetical protein